MTMLKRNRILQLSFAVLLQVFLASFSAHSAETIRLSSLSHLDTIVTMSARPLTLVWDGRVFNSSEDAQLTYDMLKLAQAWNIWIDSKGDVIQNFSRFRILYVISETGVEEEVRTKAFFLELLRRMAKLKHDPMDISWATHNVPTELAFIKRFIPMLFFFVSAKEKSKALSEAFRLDQKIAHLLRHISSGLYVVNDRNADTTETAIPFIALESDISDEDREINHFFRPPPESRYLYGDVSCGKILTEQNDEPLD